LVNPYPIFPEHFTIPRKEHIPQQIKPFFSDMLELAKSMDEFVVFYNGPKCGASAPDHLHFQAGTKNFLPLVNDYRKLMATYAEILEKGSHYNLIFLKIIYVQFIVWSPTTAKFCPTNSIDFMKIFRKIKLWSK
jgi:ATP adenylyltransferase/5',5'''-P-1,P-4-tetraphosphate phosphorylase II